MEGVWVLALAYPAAIAALFYFAFLRPVQQERKKQQKQLASLRVGDEVLTRAGLIATVKEIRIPEERGPTIIVLDLGGLEVRAVATAIEERLTPVDEKKATAVNETPRSNERSVAGRT